MPGHEPDTTMTAAFSGEDSSGLGRLTADMGALTRINQLLFENQAAMTQTAESAAVFRDQYVTTMAGLSQDVQNSMSRLIAGGYMAMARALAAMVASGRFSAAAFGQAMLRMSAQAILAVGQQAAVKAIFALAEGLLFKDPSAFVAAKLYGAVAGMALVTGSAMMGAASTMNVGSSSANSSGGSSGGGGGSSFGGGGTFAPPPQSAEQPQGGIVVNVNVQGHVMDVAALVEDHIGPEVATWAGRGGSASAEYNLTVDRD